MSGWTSRTRAAIEGSEEGSGMWDGTERRRHERYKITIAVPVEYCCDLEEDEEGSTPPWTTAGTSIPYRRRRHNGDGMDQDMRRKGAGGEAHG